jgi:hypothetical protein
MRPTFIHVLTGLLLGTALAGLLNVPGQVVAHQESIPPVSSPKAAQPKRELVVRVAPGVERPVVTKKAAPAKPRVVVQKVFVRTFQPAPQPVSPQPPVKKAAAEVKPKKTPPPAPPPPKTVLSNPQPAPPPPPPAEDEDDDGDDDDGGEMRAASQGGGDDDDDGGDDDDGDKDD